MNRRSLIARACSGVATVAATSLFGKLVGEAHGAEAPKRLVIYMSGCGIDKTFWRTDRPSDITVNSPTDFRFGGGFTPLERIKKDVLFMSEFYNSAHLDQHGNAMAALTCALDLRGKNGYLDPRPGGPTFDYFLAQKVKGSEPFPVVPLSLRAGDNVMHERVASAVDRVVPLWQGARVGFERLFGALTNGGDISAVADRNKLITRLMLADSRKLSAQLAASERVRLEEFTDSLQDMNARLERWAAAQKSNAGQTCVGPDRTRFTTNTGHGAIAQEMQLVPDIFRCGLSRFVTVVAAPGGARMHFPGYKGDGLTFPVPALEQHDINHVWLTPAIQKNQYANVIDQIRGMYAWHANVVATLWEQLKQIPEGSGKMSDRTVILWFSDAGGNHHNGWYTQPVIVVGNAGGRLRTGRCLTFPNRTHSMAEVFMTLAHALDVPTDKFGDGTDKCKETIPGVLA